MYDFVLHFDKSTWAYVVIAFSLYRFNPSTLFSLFFISSPSYLRTYFSLALYFLIGTSVGQTSLSVADFVMP
jgi:hypothetical protein